MMEADDRYLAPTAATVRDSPNNSFVWTAGLLAAFASSLAGCREAARPRGGRPFEVG